MGVGGVKSTLHRLCRLGFDQLYSPIRSPVFRLLDMGDDDGHCHVGPVVDGGGDTVDAIRRQDIVGIEPLTTLKGVHQILLDLLAPGLGFNHTGLAELAKCRI